MLLCGQLGVYGQAKHPQSWARVDPNLRSGATTSCGGWTAPRPSRNPLSNYFPHPNPLFPWICHSGGFFENVQLANINLVFGFRNVQLANMNLAFGHCACDFIQASTPVQQCLFNVCLLSSSIFTHGHRPPVNDQWSLGSQVIVVLCLRCPGFCVFCGCFWRWNIAVYISGVVNEEILEAHVLALAY